MDGFRSIVLVGLGLLAAGCRQSVAPEYTAWSVRQSAPPAPTQSSNAFDWYARAAADVESRASLDLDRVYYTPGMQDSAAKACAAALNLLERGAHLRCEFRFNPTPPFQAPPYQRGWRLLGQCLVWRIERAVAAQDNAKAIRNAVLATKFGFDLCGGGATDASLGLVIVDEARRALLPVLGRMQRTELAALSQGLANALKTKPDLEVTVENEERNMMAAVQYVQDAYRTDDYAALEKDLGSDIHNAVQYLKEMKRNDAAERPAYFRGFASEAEEEVKWMRGQAKAFAVDRAKQPQPDPRGDRPWWRFSRHFFRTLRPLLSQTDVTVARTCLLVLVSSIRQTVKSGSSAPKNLGAFPAGLTTDPFSGRAFVYHSDGADFEVYSVGADFRDNGGESDESYSAPDLKLETDLR